MSALTGQAREQILRDVIALALHLIDDTDAKQLPVDRYTFRVCHSISDDNDERGMAELARIADVLGVQITNSGGKPASGGDSHFYARKMFGGIEYEACYILHEEMTDYSAFMATRKAWRAAQAAADIPPSPPEEVARSVAADRATEGRPSTAPDFELGPLSDEAIDGALVALAGALDANPELLDDDAEVEAADEREARRTGGTFAGKYLGPVEQDPDALDRCGRTDAYHTTPHEVTDKTGTFRCPAAPVVPDADGDLITEHGDESWELDALDPATLSALISEHIDGIVDDDLYAAQEAAEAEHRELLNETSRRWPEVVALLGGAS